MYVHFLLYYSPTILVYNGKKWSYYDKKLSYDRRVVQMYVHFLLYYSPTILVYSGQKWSYYDKKLTYDSVCGGNICPFPVILDPYNRCVVLRNGHIMKRN